MSGRNKLMTRCGFLLLAAALVCLPVCGSQYIDLSKSGADTAAASPKQVLVKSQGAELKKWGVSFHSHGTHKTEAGKAAKKFSKHEWTPGGIKFTTSTELAKLKAPNGALLYFSARLLTTVDLKPEMEGKVLRCRFKIRGKRYDAPTHNHLLTGIYFTGPAKSKGGHQQVPVPARFTDSGTSQLIPKGAQKAVIFMALYGCGELEISSAEVSVSDVAPNNTDVIVTSSGFTDQQFHIPSQVPFPMYLIFQRSLKHYVRQAYIEFELPEGYSIIGSSKALGLPAKENKGKFLVNALGAIRRTITDGRFCTWRPQLVMMLSTRKPGSAPQTMKYTLVADGKRQKTRTLQLYSCEFEKAKTPRILGSGLQFPYGHEVDQNTAKMLTDTMLNLGYNIWADNSSKELADVMKARGIARIASPYQLRNGFHIQGRVPLSGDDCFRDIYGKAVPRHICPVSVYKKSAYYKGPVTEMINEAVGPGSRLDSILTNWEPYSLDFKGCFCARCGAEFARYHKLSEETVKKDWPKNIIAKYGKKWVDFRSWQHGQVVKTLAVTIREAGLKDGGKRAYFIPEISHYGFNDFMSERHTAQYHAKHYLDGLERVCIWGPYTFKAGIRTRFLYTPGHHLGYFLTTRGVDQFVKKYSAKTRIYALPHGSHCGWVSTPESIVFDTLCSFVHNAVQSTPYWFYYDYRYHREMARMNTLLAEYETEMTAWKKSPAVTVKATTPIISSRHWKGVYAGSTTGNMYPEIFSASAVQAVRWVKGEKNLVAVANLWEKDAVFVKLSLPDLKGNKWIVASEFPQSYRVCTAAELAKGIEMYIPALSWRFFRVLPYDKKLEKGKAVTASQIEELKKKLLPGVKKSFAFEEKLLSARTDDFPEYDFGAMPEIRSGNVAVSGIRLKGAQAVLVKAPAYTAVVDPEKGGRLCSFKVNGKEIAAPTADSGVGRPGCWAPIRRIIPRKMHLSAISPEKAGVRVTLRHPADSKTPFEWLVEYSFTVKGVKESFTVVNRGKKAMKVVPRFHNMLLEPARSNPVSFIMDGKKVKLPLECSLARIAAPDESCEKLFNVTNIWQGDNEVIFPRSKVRFSAVGLYGIYFWNSPGASAGSFEPTFKASVLQPGEKVTVSQSWELVK